MHMHNIRATEIGKVSYYKHMLTISILQPLAELLLLLVKLLLQPATEIKLLKGSNLKSNLK